MTATAPEHPGGAWVVHKYDLADGVTRIDVPGAAYLLHADWQHGAPKVWIQRPAEDYPEAVKLDVLVVGTGHRADLDDWKYLSTVLAHDGALVLHVYWRIRPRE